MDDEHTLRETDVRVRDALRPDGAVARRVLEHALATDGARRPRARRRQFAVAAAALALVLSVTGVIWQSRHAPSPAAPAPVSSDSLAVTGTGSIVVVEHPDGRRWIVGPPPERRAGRNYVIVMEK
jgi:hypothetical protein